MDTEHHQHQHQHMVADSPASATSNGTATPLPAAGSAITTAGASTSSLSSSAATPSTPSRYESQKRRDWNTFGQYLRSHRPPLSLSHCSGAHVLQFLSYLDQFGKTKVHTQICPFFGHPNPPAPCPCPLRQAWGSLDSLIGRLRAAYEENGGKPEANPFGAREVRLYLREVREMQSKARGVSYEKKKKRKKPPLPLPSPSLHQRLDDNNHQKHHHHHHHHHQLSAQHQSNSPSAGAI